MPRRSLNELLSLRPGLWLFLYLSEFICRITQLLLTRLPLLRPSPALLFLACSCRFNRSVLVITFTGCFKKSSGCASEISYVACTLPYPLIRAAEVPHEYQSLLFRGFLQLPKGFLHFDLMTAFNSGTITPAYLSSAPDTHTLGQSAPQGILWTLQ